MRVLAAALATAAAAASAAVPAQDWGYVTVRTNAKGGAHSFWWLYATTAATPITDTPLVMWLQGGPGASSTGFGNFNEIGPLALQPNGSLTPRTTTWLQVANLLFLDNPVGTGYSYVDDASLLTTNGTQIAADVVTLLAAFMTKYPAFQTTPFYIACESYGGHMTVEIATALLAAIDAGTIKINLRGITLGDSWVSPLDYVQAWGPYLQATSLMDSTDAAALAPVVEQTAAAVAAGQWTQATNLWGQVEGVVGSLAAGVNWYNIINFGAAEVAAAAEAARATLSPMAAAAAPPGADLPTLARLWHRHVAAPYGQRLGDPLSDLMNGQIRTQLNSGPAGKVIPDSVTWGGQSDSVFSALSGDFMRPVWNVADSLLKGGRINVTVETGQLDLICCTPGTEAWMTKLTWPGMKAFYAASKQVVNLPNGLPGGFVKNAGDGSPLTMWYVLNAGHMIPSDSGALALKMISSIIGVPSPI